MWTPVTLLLGILTGLFALLVPLLGALLLWKSAHPRPRFVRVVTVREHSRQPVPFQAVRSDPARERSDDVRALRWTERFCEPFVWLPLVTGLFLVLLPFGFGRLLVSAAFAPGQDEPRVLDGRATELRRADGSRIHVDIFGPDSGPTLVLTHGWSVSGTEWYYAKKQLAGRFRLIVWDLPGMGRTEQPRDQSDSLEQMAVDLHQVLGLAGDSPVVLVGHSIGGMANLTFARMYPEALGRQVKGIVQVDTTYTDPVRTTSNARLNLALKPVAEPVLHAIIPLSPVVRALNWLSYQEGLLYMSNAKSAFAGTETLGQLDLVSRYAFESDPGVVARGTLAMFHWDATPVLPHIAIPMLVVVGKQDTTTLPSASETMAATVSHTQPRDIDPSRHYALLEKNAVVNESIAEFAESVLR